MAVNDAGKRSASLIVGPLPAALGLAGAAVLVHLLQWGTTAPWGQAPFVGALLASTGLAWVGWASYSLRAAGTPAAFGATSSVLVEEGPYRHGRHPQYLGGLALWAGAALGLGMPSLAVSAALWWALVLVVLVPQEEARLSAHFGGWYRDYARTVRRWW
jgi:protein-S-isoprenylcysteine O-methyltransferase Ste14